jgi:chromosome segregation ATPase
MVLQNLLHEVDPIYREILSHIEASGAVRLVDEEDIESAGLELLVGFRGAPATILDAYTQSGGERSVAVIAFLLSLQQKVVSPFRAVDEFDVHMDPRNREMVFKMIFSYVKAKPNTQYIMITPSELTVLEKDVHLIFVQNTQGRSRVREVEVSEDKQTGS